MKKLFISAFKSKSSRFTAECRLIHKEGHFVYVMIGATAQNGIEKDMEIERLDGIIVDITERVYSERALVQEEKLKILNSYSLKSHMRSVIRLCPSEGSQGGRESDFLNCMRATSS